MPLYEATIPQFKKALGNLQQWLDKATEFATSKSFDPSVLLTARLAPDQFPLIRQIQSACDGAKTTSARLTGKQPPVHPDTEQTLDEIRARISTVLAYLDTFSADDFKGADTRKIPLFFMPGKAALGADYLNEFCLPNFYFHLTTAYAILRHNGVALGKMDFIGSMTVSDV